MRSKRGSKVAVPASISGEAFRRSRAATVTMLFAVGLFSSQGCYSYQATELPSIPPRDEVRLTLGSDEFSRIAPGALAGSPRRVEGRFLRITDDTVAVSVWIGEAYRGTPFESARQELSIARADVVRVEQRQLSRWRTAAVAVGSVVLIAGLIDGIGMVEVFGGDGRGGPPLPPAPARLPH